MPHSSTRFSDDNPVPRQDKVAALVVMAGGHACAIPIDHVVETMRPLAIEPLAGAPPYVRGMSMVRGAPVPVVDLGALLAPNAASDSCTRFVIIRADERQVALLVGSVVGLRWLDSAEVGQLPPLLRDTATAVVTSIGASDEQLLLVLGAARILPDEHWALVSELIAR